MGRCPLWGRIWNTYFISLLKNYRRCKYILIFLKINSTQIELTISFHPLTHCSLMTPYGDRSGSALSQEMACCLTAPSHYLNQCWLIFSKVQWHSVEGNLTRDSSPINHYNKLENYLSKIYLNLPGANELSTLLSISSQWRPGRGTREQSKGGPNGRQPPQWRAGQHHAGVSWQPTPGAEKTLHPLLLKRHHYTPQEVYCS